MIDVLTVLLSSITIYLTGYFVLCLFPDIKKTNILLRLGFSYGLGVGIVTFLLFIFSIGGVEFSRANILFPLAVLWMILYRKNSFFRKVKLNKIYLPKYAPVLLGVLILAVGYVLLEALIRPVSAWDAWSTWYFAGKAFFIDKELNSFVYRYAQFENPPVIQLLISYTYVVMGKQNDTLSLFNFYLFYISIILLLTGYIKEKVGAVSSLVIAVLFATLPLVVRHAGRFDVGNADLPLAYFFLSSVLLLLFWLKNRSFSSLLMLEIFLGIGSVVKNEGITFLFIVQAILILHVLLKKQNLLRNIVLFFVGSVPFITWAFYKQFNLIPKIYLLNDSPHVERIPVIFATILPEFINIGRWNLLWVVFMVLLIYSFHNKSIKGLYILIPAICQFFVYLYIYVITSGDTDFVTQIHGTFDRLLLHLTPIIMLWIGLHISGLLSMISKKKLV